MNFADVMDHAEKGDLFRFFFLHVERKTDFHGQFPDPVDMLSGDVVMCFCEGVF
ncbi:MAG: hypothetical protein MUO63_07020 [Desulfobulbaceae bacterium]|nr:hypothetical protein [Desulfobulbaceae bacterium]